MWVVGKRVYILLYLTLPGVLTDHGRVECDTFINACGLWARELGQLSQPPVAIPLHACEHFYVVR